MNFNFHHQRYAKCTKCHKIHQDIQQEPNIRLLRDRTSLGFHDTLNNEDNIDMGAESDGNTEKELDKYCYSFESRPSRITKYETEKPNQKSGINRRNPSHRYQNVNPDDYTESHVPRDADIARPLEKLQQLQRQRASSERFYSQEIKKIISEYFIGDCDTDKNRRDKSFERDKRIRAGGNEDFEQCGTITTIAELDCGCVQKTRRPIYTPCMIDTRGNHYYHCTDGEIDGDTETIISKPSFPKAMRHQDKPTSHSYMTRKLGNETATELPVHNKTHKVDAINSKQSTLKSKNSKLFRNSIN